MIGEPERAGERLLVREEEVLPKGLRVQVSGETSNLKERCPALRVRPSQSVEQETEWQVSGAHEQQRTP